MQDLSECAREPIQMPGAIQPSGALLVLDVASLRILVASDSALEILGHSAASLLGLPASDLFDADSIVCVRTAMAGISKVPGDHQLLGLQGSDRRFYGWLHGSAEYAILDLEPYVEECTRELRLLGSALDKLAKFVGTEPLSEILQNTVQALHELSGFDRVFVYSFDPQWHGKVVAEVCNPQVESYLGLHYPASDIPERARELYREVRVRQIVDVNYQPSSLRGEPGLAALDIRHSCLRSSTPARLAYLRNMGVAATLVGSLLVEGKLWGLLICHHVQGSKALRGFARAMFLRLCNLAAQQITASLAKQAEQLALLRVRVLETIVECLEQGDLEALVSGTNVDLLLQAFGADGFALLTWQRFLSAGSTPQESELRALIAQRKAATLAFSHPFSGQQTSGVLLLDLADRQESKLLWFRSQRPISLRWGGNPSKPVEFFSTQQLIPRNLIAPYEQTGYHLPPWTPEEVKSAESLRASIQLSLERHLKLEMRSLQRLTATSNAAILVTEASPSDPRIIIATKAFETDSGYSAAEVLGRSPRFLQGPETDRATLARIREKLERWEGVEAEVLNYRKDGSTYWVELKISPVTDAYGWVTHWVSVQSDVTERRRFQESLEQQNRALERSLREIEALVKAKSALLANIGREIRTPLAVILGHTELAQQIADAPPRVSQALSTVHMNARQLLDMVHAVLADASSEPPSAVDTTISVRAENSERVRQSKARFFAAASHDLLQPLNAARIYASALSEQTGISAAVREMAERIDHALIAAEEIIDVLVDVTKLDSGAMAVEITEFPLCQELAALATQMSSLAASRQLELRVQPCNWVIRSDRRLLRRVLQNLISNALRYTAKGGVLITTRKRGDSLFIEVWDTGIGIAPKHQAAVFDEFSRINQLSPWGDRGSGLGLAICDRICRLLGHQLSLDSRLGRGSRFRVSVPLLGRQQAVHAAAPNNPIRATSDAMLVPLSVLCVDDDPDILRSLCTLLRGWGVQVATADGRAAAFAALNASAPDVMLVDQQLGPEELGTDLLRDARLQLGSTLLGGALVTADHSEQLKELCQQSGFYLLHKPMKAVRLRGLMTHFAELKSAREHAERTS